MNKVTASVYYLTCKIPKGKVVSYSELGKAVGVNARKVAWLMKKNPYAPFVPCHRVVQKNGCLGGYSGPGGVKKKKQLLEAEGVTFVERRICKRCFYYFKK